MALIKVNPEGLRQNLGEIDTCIRELEGLNARLDALLGSIGSSWDGEASEQYIASMTRHKAKAAEMAGVLGELRRYMQQAADRFEQVDRDGAARIRGSF